MNMKSEYADTNDTAVITTIKNIIENPHWPWRGIEKIYFLLRPDIPWKATDLTLYHTYSFV